MPRCGFNGRTGADRCFEFAIRAGSMPPAAPKAKSNRCGALTPDQTKASTKGQTKRRRHATRPRPRPFLNGKAAAWRTPSGPPLPGRMQAHTPSHATRLAGNRCAWIMPQPIWVPFVRLGENLSHAVRRNATLCVGFVAACSVQSGGDRDLFGVCHLHLQG